MFRRKCNIGRLSATFSLAILLSFLVTNSGNDAFAQDNWSKPTKDSWTEIGVYGFISDISGDTKVSNVTAPVDVSFSDLLKNLDMGFMGFAEHRRGKWSFIGDLIYAAISVEQSLAVTSTASVKLDVEVKQLMAEGFVGYRVAEQAQDDGTKFRLDLLGGIRYSRIEVDLSANASQLGLGSASRNPSIDWADGVIGVRAQYGGDRGWGVSGWADVGKGSDSSSFQLAGFVNYRFDNNVRLFGGYRHYAFKYETGSGTSFFELDLEMSGPMIGASFRF